GMAIRAVTAALQAAAQNDTEGSLVALASPYLNQAIHEMTAGDTAKDKAANLMAHALLSAVEFQVTGKDPLTGAVAGVTGEVTAQILTQAIYNKTPNQLTANEKENISTLSQLAGGLAAALTAKANGTTAEQGGSFLAATSGAETAKRAVENNYLSVADVENLIRELSKAQKEGRDTKPILEKYEGISEENRQQLIACNGNVACETAHLHEMNTGAEELERNLGFFSRMTVYYPNDLNTANRIALSNLVERENAESFSKLSDTTKFGLNAMEAGTAIGLGAAAGSAKVGLSKLNSLISGKNKAYPTSGMDGYKRANVGDEDYRSSGAENTALYPKLKEELAMKQKAGFEKVVKDLSKKPTGSVLMIPDYRHQLSEARSTLSPKLQRSGNAAVAQINIDGLTTRKLVGHSQIDKAQGSFVGQGETKFESLKLPNKKGDLIDRRVDSEYKILSNLADQLGSNRQAKGQVTIFTERPACLSCLGVVDQFTKRYPNIKVNVFDNNGKAIKHNGEK
ncbi:deaminase domain-containing protein, partial [Haemophilus parainfluenzae]|uniref:deaminase domain-containing protein n=1 Tax=Haemophilus parainfluenzae TaxID=729 RepID=UPI001D0BED72